MTVNKAFFVIDVQPIFMKDPLMLTLDGADLVEKCADLLEQARTRGTPVVPAGTTDEELAFHAALAPREDEPVIGKMFGSGFMETVVLTRPRFFICFHTEFRTQRMGQSDLSVH